MFLINVFIFLSVFINEQRRADYDRRQRSADIVMVRLIGVILDDMCVT